MIDNIRPASIDLSYDDPFEPTIPIEAIVARAGRVRVRRRAGAAFGLLLVVALGMTVVWATPEFAPRSSRGSNPLAQLHNADDPLVIVDRTVPGWESFVYLSPTRSICGGSMATTGAERYTLATACWIDATDAMNGTWVMKPIFQNRPAPWEDSTRAYAIGLVRADATKVVVTFRGVPFTAAVVPIALPGSTGFGAYTVQLPVRGLSSYSWSDISSVVAEDSAGKIVCQTH